VLSSQFIELSLDTCIGFFSQCLCVLCVLESSLTVSFTFHWVPLDAHHYWVALNMFCVCCDQGAKRSGKSTKTAADDKGVGPKSKGKSKAHPGKKPATRVGLVLNVYQAHLLCSCPRHVVCLERRVWVGRRLQAAPTFAQQTGSVCCQGRRVDLLPRRPCALCCWLFTQLLMFSGSGAKVYYGDGTPCSLSPKARAECDRIHAVIENDVGYATMAAQYPPSEEDDSDGASLLMLVQCVNVPE
jgi:hypothetical protein